MCTICDWSIIFFSIFFTVQSKLPYFFNSPDNFVFTHFLGIYFNKWKNCFFGGLFLISQLKIELMNDMSIFSEKKSRKKKWMAYKLIPGKKYGTFGPILKKVWSWSCWQLVTIEMLAALIFVSLHMRQVTLLLNYF